MSLGCENTVYKWEEKIMLKNFWEICEDHKLNLGFGK